MKPAATWPFPKPPTSIEYRVAKRIKEQIGSSAPIIIAPEAELFTNLGFDSLDHVELMMALEEEFDLRIDDDEFCKVKTARDVIDLIARLQGVSA